MAQLAGRALRPARVSRPMSSNGLTEYTTVEWVDPATGVKYHSCNCPGWAFKKGGQARTCKHVEALLRGVIVSPVTNITTPEEAVDNVPTIAVDARRLRAICFE